MFKSNLEQIESRFKEVTGLIHVDLSFNHIAKAD